MPKRPKRDTAPQQELEKVYPQFALALRRYIAETSTLCELFRRCADNPSDVMMHKRMMQQRHRHNSVRAQYKRVRQHLLNVIPVPDLKSRE